MKLSQIDKCACCGEGLMAGSWLIFYKTEVTTETVDLKAIQRAHGMENLMGGNVALARAMGVDEQIAVPMAVKTGYVCYGCATNLDFMSVLEKLKEKPLV